MRPNSRREMYLAAMAGADVEIPTPVSREEAYLARIAESADDGGSGGVTSWNDLTDKPFDATTVFVDAVTEQSVEYEGDGDHYWANGVETNENINVSGTYVVYLNGNEYICTPRMANIMDGQYYILGNPHYFSGMFDGSYVENENTGEPFAFVFDLFNEGQVHWSVDFGESITFKVVEKQEKIKHIDNKFVQNSTFTVVLSNEWDEEIQDTKWKVDQTIVSIVAAVRAGKTVRMFFGDTESLTGQFLYLEAVTEHDASFVGILDGNCLVYVSVGEGGVDVLQRDLLLNEEQ